MKTFNEDDVSHALDCAYNDEQNPEFRPFPEGSCVLVNFTIFEPNLGGRDALFDGVTFSGNFSWVNGYGQIEHLNLSNATIGGSLVLSGMVISELDVRGLHVARTVELYQSTIGCILCDPEQAVALSHYAPGIPLVYAGGLARKLGA